MKARFLQWNQLVAVMLVVVITLGAIAPVAKAQSDNQAITVLLNDTLLELEVDPLVRNGTTLVPMRPLFEALGLKVKWDPAAGTIQGTKEGLQLSLTIGSKDALINGQAVKLAEPAIVRSGYTLVPIRFISEASDALVLWQPYLKQVYLYDVDFLKENNLTKESVTQNFNQYLEDSLAEYLKQKEKAEKEAEKQKNKDKDKDKDNKPNPGMCSVWRYHPVYGGSLEWVPCP